MKMFPSPTSSKHFTFSCRRCSGRMLKFDSDLPIFHLQNLVPKWISTAGFAGVQDVMCVSIRDGLRSLEAEWYILKCWRISALTAIVSPDSHSAWESKEFVSLNTGST